jgi:hypothetical protein
LAKREGVGLDFPTPFSTEGRKPLSVGYLLVLLHGIKFRLHAGTDGIAQLSLQHVQPYRLSILKSSWDVLVFQFAEYMLGYDIGIYPAS